MRKTLIFVTCGLLCILTLIACDKLFVGVSGKEADLQGKWQMDEADAVFFNFQNSLFRYQGLSGRGSGTGYYTLYEDTYIELRLLQEHTSSVLARYLSNLEWETLPSSTDNQDTITKTYHVEKLAKKKLILSSGNERLSFHKF